MLDLAYESLAVLAALGGMILLYWSMFRDRSRGRRRCPKCWYDLRGTESRTCAECGHTAKRERQLFKTKRRWRLAVPSAALLCASYVLWIMPRARQDGWLAVLPTPIVIAAMPYEPTLSVKELRSRWLAAVQDGNASNLTRWEFRLAISRAKTLLDARFPLRQRADMLQFILWIDDDQPVGDILQAWFDDPNSTIGTVAISLVANANLAPVGEHAIAERLYKLAQPTDYQTAMLATRALGRFVNDDQRYVDLLVTRLNDPDFGMRANSAFALCGLRAPDARVLGALCALMESGNYGATSAIETLGFIGDSTVALPLAEAMRSSDWSISTKCSDSLLKIDQAARSNDVTSALVANLSDANPAVRGSAAAALVGQGALAAPFLPQLIESLDDESTETAVLVLVQAHVIGSDSPILAPMIAAMAEVGTAHIEESTEPYKICEYLITLMMWNPAHADAFVPLLVRFMNGPSEGLQERAAISLGSYGVQARSALPALHEALGQTTSENVKQAIQDAIAAISASPPPH